MILYLDTSALVKLYVEEDGSHTIRKARNTASIIPTSLLAYAEVRTAFARAYGDKGLSKSLYQAILEDFNEDWDRYFALEVTWEIVRQAGDLAEEHRLRSFDAIHLASALQVQAVVEDSLSFLSFDDRLTRAAKARGLVVGPSFGTGPQ